MVTVFLSIASVLIFLLRFLCIVFSAAMLSSNKSLCLQPVYRTLKDVMFNGEFQAWPDSVNQIFLRLLSLDCFLKLVHISSTYTKQLPNGTVEYSFVSVISQDFFLYDLLVRAFLLSFSNY